MIGQEVVDLDAMALDARDALPVGVAQIDATGAVIAYNTTLASLTGVPEALAIGRNFFRDVAPATHLPDFAGRFWEAVRRGAAETSFEFVFSGDPEPLHAAVEIRAATLPGRYWIVVTPIARLEPRRERAAQIAIGRRTRAEPVDPTVCEREPIHTPGAVQPHAVMLAADLSRLSIAACSANVGGLLDLETADVLGRALDDVLPAQLMRLIRNGLANGTLDSVRHIRRTVRLLSSYDQPFVAEVHAHDGRLIVELERAPASGDDFAEASHLDTEATMARIREAGDLVEAATITASEIRALTGFEAVLVYRFDADWNGEAIAEDKVADWDRALLGLRFPASDIPAQARALYTQAKSRFVIDRDYVPVPLLAKPEAGNAPVDLTHAHSRSLSPIHLEYQRNLGVNGSMSISILVEGRLWGLMIGHHRRPHYVSPESRGAATVLTEAFALHISEIEARRLWREQQGHLVLQSALLRQMAGSDDFVAALTEGPRTILDLFGSGGAATVSEGRVKAVGRTPPARAVIALAAWLRQQIPAGELAYATSELPLRYGADWTDADVASGVLAVFVDEAREHLILWFRPEEPSAITWGGDPRKAVIASSDAGTILPRRSFERWVEERRGASAPWLHWYLEIAEALAEAVEGVVLRQRRRIADLTVLLEEKERLLAQKDLLSREIDHRVKNSLQIVSAFLQMQRRQVSDPSAQAAFADTAARVMSVARVHDSLYQTESVEEVDLGQTIERLCADLIGMTGGRHDLDLKADAGLMVPYRKAVALSLIATELVTNAFKYAYSPDMGGRVEVTVRGEGEGVWLSVCDDGQGLPEGWHPGFAQGTGLGMKLVRTMLDQMNARLEVASLDGTCFTVHA